MQNMFFLKKGLQKGYATINLETTFAQNNNSKFETKSKDYTLLNLGFGGNVNFGKTKFDLSLNANNLLNRSYVSHLSRLKPDGISNIGRNIVLGVNFNI